MVKFGPSGNSNEFYESGLKNSEQAPKWLAEKGLTLYEYSFGRGTNITDKKCEIIGSEAEKYGVAARRARTVPLTAKPATPLWKIPLAAMGASSCLPAASFSRYSISKERSAAVDTAPSAGHNAL